MPRNLGGSVISLTALGDSRFSILLWVCTMDGCTCVFKFTGESPKAGKLINMTLWFKGAGVYKVKDMQLSGYLKWQLELIELPAHPQMKLV